MIVQCESCETRFHVADARIPEKGARVRCSRCHHRFHITPSSATSAAPAPAADGSARPSARGGEPRAAGNDEQLDNPEFLFDDQEPTAGSRTPAKTPPTTKLQKPPTPAVAKPKPEAKSKAKPAEKPAPGKPAGMEPPAAPPEPVVEERVVVSGGQTAQQMLDAGAPELGASKGEFGGALVGNGIPEPEAGDDEADDTRSRFFLGEEAEAKEPPKPTKPAAKPSPVSAKDDKFKDIDAAFGGGVADDDTGDAGWEALTKDAPASVFEAGASFGMGSESGSDASAADEQGAAQEEAEVPKAAAKKRRARKAADFDPEAGSSAALIVRIAAVLVGVALLGGAVRGLSLQREATTSAPAIEQAAGWVAADVETFVARDSTGSRVLVVRGNLFPDGAAPPPDVEVSLLETDGARVGEPRRAWLQRLDDAEIAPDRLALRLASSAGELSGTGPQVTGFTALLPDPPARARRVSIALTAGPPLPPPGTAIAVNPPPAAPARELAPPSAPAPAAPPTATASEAPPAAPPAPLASPTPVPSKARPELAPDAVVPAAPAPDPE